MISDKPSKKSAWRLVLVLVALVSMLAGIFLAAGFNITQNTSALSPSTPEMVPASFTEVALAVSPAVVNIRTEKVVKGGGPVFRHFQSPF